MQVYFWKENKFKLISSQNFPKCEPGKCVICPISYSKYDNKQVLCRNRIEKFGAFKAHLANAERTFGELVAFPADCKSLPSVSIYHKFRRYGQLHSYIQGSKEVGALTVKNTLDQTLTKGSLCSDFTFSILNKTSSSRWKKRILASCTPMANTVHTVPANERCILRAPCSSISKLLSRTFFVF